MRRTFVLLAAAACVVTSMIVVGVPAQGTLTPKEELGKFIFEDENLSINGNQSCASCHAREVGWTGPISSINARGAVYEGSIPGAFGDRKPPSAAYATQSPVLSVDRKGLFVGGNFWDGRATGERLGSPAAEQAQGPFLNPMEQALASPADVVSRVCAASYNDLVMDVCGAAACSGELEDVPAAYNCIGYSVAAYEASAEVNAFTSKFDYSKKGMAKLSQEEQAGHALFLGKGKCAKCHIANGQKPLFTDYTFDNLGIPKNPANPFYGTFPDYIDKGLGGFLHSRPDYEAYAAANMGKHKVPTTRNVDLRTPGLVKAYGHNGYFKSLEGIVHFYNTRDVRPVCPGDYTEAQAMAARCWPSPEVADNVNTAELGDLGLSAEEEAALVAFLRTLSDGYPPNENKAK
jgi:cytochrome c peroxidase